MTITTIQVIPQQKQSHRSPAQIKAAKQNIKLAQQKRQSMTHREHSLSQPEGRDRKKPGTTGKGKFYHIEIRPKSQFTSFRIQDVGDTGGLERVAGRRSSGSRATVAWLISKDVAHVTKDHKLIIDDVYASSVLSQIRGEITWLKGDIFSALPRRNIAEKDKPTPAQKNARARNIKKAQKVWKLMHTEA